MAPLQREDRVAEDDRVEIEENYGCQSSALDLYLHVPLARGSFPCARWSVGRIAACKAVTRLKTLLGTRRVILVKPRG